MCVCVCLFAFHHEIALHRLGTIVIATIAVSLYACVNLSVNISEQNNRAQQTHKQNTLNHTCDVPKAKRVVSNHRRCYQCDQTRTQSAHKSKRNTQTHNEQKITYSYLKQSALSPLIADAVSATIGAAYAF
jgi:hypothetical protein